MFILDIAFANLRS